MIGQHLRYLAHNGPEHAKHVRGVEQSGTVCAALVTEVAAIDEDLETEALEVDDSTERPPQLSDEPTLVPTPPSSRCGKARLADLCMTRQLLTRSTSLLQSSLATWPSLAFTIVSMTCPTEAVHAMSSDPSQEAIHTRECYLRGLYGRLPDKQVPALYMEAVF